MRRIRASQFANALSKIDPPLRGKRLQFLLVHYRARGRSRTARQLAESVNYKNHGGINLWYGKLAHKIGEELHIEVRCWLSLLVTFKPPSVTNKEYILVMLPEFAEALERLGWV